MPTPVSAARQCLTPEAAHALDEAVAVARRRGHAQTTSLHAVSALLSLPASILRDACARSRNAAYSSRLQFKALELCLSVSLDRVPSSQLSDDPPVSNSLMAAIKRSQANQRRQPENFQLYHQISQHSSMSCVKVELQHLVLSILDDPVVSRVFGEAGFLSSEIKLAIVRPIPQLFSCSRPRAPPLFHNENPDTVHRVGFPFLGYPGLLDLDENGRRIGEVLIRNKGRNPLLVGMYAYGSLRSFIDSVEKRKESVLPVELTGLSVVSIEDDVLRFLLENQDKNMLNLRFEEVGFLANRCLGAGLVVNYGDLKIFIQKNGLSDSVSYVVSQLTRLLGVYGGKVWLIGAAASYETYLNFVRRFPSAEKDWDLQLLPITSIRPSVAETYPKSSLMESFVPFGGLFSTLSDFSGSHQSIPRCRMCDDKCKEEVNAVTKGGLAASVADQYWSNLPSWLQMAELDVIKEFHAKTRDDGVALSTRVSGLQKKWDTICRNFHQRHLYPNSNIMKSNSQTVAVVGFQFDENGNGVANKLSMNTTNASLNEPKCNTVSSCMPLDSEMLSASQSGSGISFPVVPKTKSLLSSLQEEPAAAKNLKPGNHKSTPCSFSISAAADCPQSPLASATSVTTELGLRICSASNAHKETMSQDSGESPKDFSSCFSANDGLIHPTSSKQPAIPSTYSHADLSGQFHPKEFKVLHGALMRRVSWQGEAMTIISNTIVNHQKGKKRHGASARGDLWFNFAGLDRFGKKRTAIALAEIIYGSRDNFTGVDFGSPERLVDLNTNFNNHGRYGCDLKFRGKTMVDYVAEELYKKPLSIIFLENVDKADLLAQRKLAQAVLTGKFSDSHGREIGINSTIFVLTSEIKKNEKVLSSRKDYLNYSEEGVVRAKFWPIKVLIEHVPCNKASSHCTSALVTTGELISNSCLLNKRKLTDSNETIQQHETLEVAKRAYKKTSGFLDLNLPAQENELQATDDGTSDDSLSDTSRPWLENFLDQMDETVVFKPFDFEALAEKITNEIYDKFCEIIGSECSVEIDSKVMEQLLAAAYFSERDRVVEDWVDQVLGREFTEVQERNSLTSHSVVKLVSYEGFFLQEQAPGVCPPPVVTVD